jgi:hypothetical protein
MQIFNDIKIEGFSEYEHRLSILAFENQVV